LAAVAFIAVTGVAGWTIQGVPVSVVPEQRVAEALVEYMMSTARFDSRIPVVVTSGTCFSESAEKGCESARGNGKVADRAVMAAALFAELLKQSQRVDTMPAGDSIYRPLPPLQVAAFGNDAALKLVRDHSRPHAKTSLAFLSASYVKGGADSLLRVQLTDIQVDRGCDSCALSRNQHEFVIDPRVTAKHGWWRLSRVLVQHEPVYMRSPVRASGPPRTP
jgi:hypothetical protein